MLWQKLPNTAGERIADLQLLLNLYQANMVRLEEVVDEAFVQEKDFEDDEDYTDTGKLPQPGVQQYPPRQLSPLSHMKPSLLANLD